MTQMTAGAPGAAMRSRADGGPRALVVINGDEQGRWAEADDNVVVADNDRDFAGAIEGVNATYMAELIRDARKYYKNSAT